MPLDPRLLKASLLGLFLALSVPSVLAQESELFSLKNRWENITTQMPEDSRAKALEELADEASTLVRQYPDNARVLIWQGIVVASQARVSGGLTALGLAKEARSILERGIKLDPQGNNGSAYVTLGALYDRVPGWPVGFGDSETAEAMFQKALAIRPKGIDVNYYYAAFLEDQGRKDKALEHARRAVNGEARSERQISDEALRGQARRLLASLQ
nr:TRAP transporter TatT component family protein [uncultured Halomonas sp.]